MKKEIVEILVEETRALMDAKTCCAEAKQAAQTWLASDKSKEHTKAYMEALKEVIVTVDELIAFAESKEGMAYFGADVAKDVALHGLQLKQEGAVYCDCPACAKVEAILQYAKEI